MYSTRQESDADVPDAIQDVHKIRGTQCSEWQAFSFDASIGVVAIPKGATLRNSNN